MKALIGIASIATVFAATTAEAHPHHSPASPIVIDLSVSTGSIVGLVAGVTARPGVPAGAFSQRIDRTVQTPAYEYGDPKNSIPAFGWNVRYDRYFDGSKVVKHVEIDFQFAEGTGLDDAQKTAWKSQAEKNIEGVWNNKFFVEDTNNRLVIPVMVDVTLTGPFDQTVSIVKRPGDCATRANDLDCRDNLAKWFTDSKAATQAHEFGHMIGLYDEYLGGAVDKFPGPTLSTDGVMGFGALLDNPKMYARYYQQYEDFLSGISFDTYRSLVGARVGEVTVGAFVLRPVPEPGAWILTLVGLAVLASYRVLNVARRSGSAKTLRPAELARRLITGAHHAV